MKKKSVVLCELHDEDRLAVAVLHIGVCAECNAAIARIAAEVGTQIAANGEVNGNNTNGKRKRRKDVTDAEKRQMHELRSSGVPLKKVSEMFQVSPSTVTRYANMAQR